MIKSFLNNQKTLYFTNNNFKYFCSNIKIFQGKEDVFYNIHVSPEEIEGMDNQFFQKSLINTLDHYKTENKTALWIRLNKTEYRFCQILSDQGLKVHHATNDQIVFNIWLDSQKKCQIPDFTSHYIGCGAVVIQNNKVLIVQEKTGNRQGLWGVPGGLCDNHELIHTAAIRELYEETGLVGEYQDLLSIREVLPSKFDRPDIYFAFLIKLKDQDQQVKLDPIELSNYLWLDIQQIPEFLKEGTTQGTQVDLLTKIYDLNQKQYKFYESKLFTEQLGKKLIREKNYDYNIYNPNFLQQ